MNYFDTIEYEEYTGLPEDVEHFHMREDKHGFLYLLLCVQLMMRNCTGLKVPRSLLYIGGIILKQKIKSLNILIDIVGNKSL